MNLRYGVHARREFQYKYIPTRTIIDLLMRRAYCGYPQPPIHFINMCAEWLLCGERHIFHLSASAGARAFMLIILRCFGACRITYKCIHREYIVGMYTHINDVVRRLHVWAIPQPDGYRFSLICLGQLFAKLIYTHMYILVAAVVHILHFT